MRITVQSLCHFVDNNTLAQLFIVMLPYLSSCLTSQRQCWLTLYLCCAEGGEFLHQAGAEGQKTEHTGNGLAVRSFVGLVKRAAAHQSCPESPAKTARATPPALPAPALPMAPPSLQHLQPSAKVQ